jgi:hypothetical protein
LKRTGRKNIGGFKMRGQKKDLAFDAILTLVAYLIFAISLLAVNIVKYPNLRVGFNILVILSGIFMYYNLHNFNKGLK